MPLIDDLLRHAQDRPHAPAAADPTRSLDWASLRDEVAAVATGLAARGVGPGDRVGIHLPNSLDFLVVALGAGWLGATFVGLDVSSPPARTVALIADFEPAVVATTATDPPAAGLGAVPTTRPDDLRASGVAVRRPQPPTGPAYLIYTSGTTGTPKGVAIGHAALDASLSAMNEIIELTPSTRSMCVSPFHFDGSYATLLGTVHAGGFVTIPDRASLVFPRNFLRWIEHHAVDVTGFTPTYLRLLAAGRALPAIGSGSLRVLGLGGEALAATDVLALLRAAPELRVFNRYGPTETTIAVAHHRLGAEDLRPGEPVPIGRPHRGTRFLVLTDSGEPVPAGRAGELWIGGPQLMDGYWGAPELTASVLQDDVVPGEALYRTGDIVRAGSDGVFTWLDRADRVVKRRGLRISLAEVANALMTVDGVEGAAAVAVGQAPDTRIVAFAVLRGCSVEAARAGAGERLPEAMLPDHIVHVESLPLTSSGKLDERRLLADAASVV